MSKIRAEHLGRQALIYVRQSPLLLKTQTSQKLLNARRILTCYIQFLYPFGDHSRTISSGNRTISNHTAV